MKLNQEEILIKLSLFPKWEIVDAKLVREYVLKNFSEALSFIVQIGMNAEKLNHHPDIKLHSWNKVKVTIFTHSENAITENDFQLLELIEKI